MMANVRRVPDIKGLPFYLRKPNTSKIIKLNFSAVGKAVGS